MRSAGFVRPCAVSGLFYPAEKEALRNEIALLLGKSSPPKTPGRIRGIISPHAGYVYSGFTAAHGYSLLKGERYDSVVIVSPSHREYFDGISLFPGDAYSTPLGEVPVNVDLRERLLNESDDLHSSVDGHRDEHAIEVQLPFLQEVLREFTILPIVLGDQRRELCLELGRALGMVLRNENALLVASTDLSHYHSGDVADTLDNVMIEDVRNFDYEQLLKDLSSGRTEACGGGPTVAVLHALKNLGITQIDILHHCNSGDVTGDRTQVVGYLSAVVYS